MNFTYFKNIDLTTEQILLLISATGEFAYLFFGLLAATAAFNPDKLDNMILNAANNTTTYKLKAENALTFVTNTVDITQISIQSFALILATASANFRWNTESSEYVKAKYIITEILYYLCVCNAAKWVTDSFIEGHYLRSSEAKILVFGETTWKAITQATYPLVLFYRFHSVHMVLKVIDKINKD
mgnify:FL=1